MTGPPGLVSRINLNSQSTCLHTSGLSQAMVLAFFEHYVRRGAGRTHMPCAHSRRVALACVGCEQRMFEEVVAKTEGLGTFEEHLTGIRRFYRAQRDAAVKLAHKHLDGTAACAHRHTRTRGGSTRYLLAAAVVTRARGRWFSGMCRPGNVQRARSRHVPVAEARRRGGLLRADS